ncbi:MAG TPA: ABC-F family ATP-binding cassette domain-containing protein [Candidatus Babeliales bacterium]|nr:ABC-F family ATP-binding cassette domain-containing protein [Candidatus Babeliales bacterium]
MSILMLNNISLSYGERTLFDDISVDFQEDQKIGIVGRNGAGKSTLLKIISGMEQPDSGIVSKERGKTVAYMAQEMVLESHKNIYDEAFTVFEVFTALEIEQSKIEAELEKAPDHAEQLLERYMQIQEKLARFDRIQSEKNTEDILIGLGFKREQFNKPVQELSVGWKMRLVLAKLLLEQADFYLFDEPTNHLDITAKEWFFKFLRQAPFGFLLVSHDRYFLEKACDLTFELSHGKGTLYHGSYTYYIEQKEERNRVLQSAHARQQREITKKKETIDRFRASASKAKMAQSMMKQLDRIERIEIEPAEPTIYISFPEPSRPGKVILTVKDVSHSFDGKQLFNHASCEIGRGQKVALLAPNGTGKTTLFNLICGKLPLQHGTVEFGHNVEHALFEQDQTRALNGESTIFDEIQSHTKNVGDATIRSFLGSFLFSGSDVEKKIKVLSGGEKNRVAMVKVLLQNANFLLLDEPTNHLDLFAKSVMLQALKKYPGTILFVSHDHDFIQELATDILELSPNGLYHYPGKYEEFLQDTKQDYSDTVAVTPQAPQAAAPIELSKQRKKDLQKLEAKIASLEKKIADLNLTLETLSYGTPEFSQATEQVVSAQKQLEDAEKKWERWQAN